MFQTTNLFLGGQYDGYLDAAVEKKNNSFNGTSSFAAAPSNGDWTLALDRGRSPDGSSSAKLEPDSPANLIKVPTNQPANQAAPEASRLNHYYKIYHESNSPKQTIARGFALHSILPGEHTIVDTEDMLSGLKWDNKNTQKHRSHFPGRSCIDFHMAYAHT